MDRTSLLDFLVIYMARLNWCKRQNHGIKKVEPSKNVSQGYIENAEETLRILKKIMETGSKTWIATLKYYTEYFSFYSLMMRIGIKSEIHDCTLEVAKFLEERNIIDKEVVEELEDSKDLRIKNQYHLKNRPVDVDLDELSDFILEVKDIKDNLSNDQINKIRKDLFD